MVQVIIPVYNAASYLESCLQSLLAQTMPDWQAILVDDCSTDNSLSLLEDYASRDERFIVVKHEKNGGVSAARNTALEKATGEYLMFLDSDDTIEPDTLAILLREATGASTPFDVVQCRYRFDFPNGIYLTPAGAFRQSTTLCGKEIRRIYRKMCTGINMNHVCMKLIRRELVADIRFDTSQRTGEDLVFCARMFERVGRYRFVDAVLYHYTRSAGSLTGGGLPFSEKWKANSRAAVVIRESMKRVGIQNPFYYLLTVLRIYIISVSKVLRQRQEKKVLGEG